MIFMIDRPDLDNFALVFTMGKVGSTALVRSLEAVNIFCRHIQFLSPEWQMSFGKDQLHADPIEVALTILNTRRCYHALSDPHYAPLVKVITVIRAPVEQILSCYLHVYDQWSWQMGEENLTVERVVADILEHVECYMERSWHSISSLAEITTSTLDRSLLFHSCVLNYTRWFECELRPFFPVNIAAGVVKDGYQIADNVLFLKFEELQVLGEKAVQAFVQRPHFKLLRANVGAEKHYSNLYRGVIDTIKFPNSFVNHVCRLEIVQHFYSEPERQEMCRRWAV